MPTLDVLDDEQVEAIHEASLDVLERLGIEFMGAGARRIAARGGGRGRRRERSRPHPARARRPLRSRPHRRRFTVTPRNPTRRLELGGDRVAFGLVAGPPWVHDAVGGRRTGNLADYERLLRLAQSFDAIHFVGNQPTAPVELPAETRHLDCYLANLTLTDRVYHCTAIGRDRALDGIAMMAIARGKTLEEVVDDPCVLTIVNVNSPRRFDEAMSDGLQAMAEHGQPVVVTPFTLMGAMTPVTLAAALVQQNAEALAGVVLDAAHADGRSRRLRRVHVERRPPQRRARLRDARERAGDAGRRAARAALRASRTARATRALRTRSTRRRHTSRRCRSGRPCSAAPTSSTTAPAGWRAG